MRLNAGQLKMIAVITMVIDHAGAILFPGMLWLRYIGRISFPIFAFLLVEGFFHTHDVRRYLLRLGAFAVLSEIPYDLAFHRTVLEVTSQNVFFTLFLGLLLLCVADRMTSRLEQGAVTLIVMWAANMLGTDYRWKGILLIALFYFLYRKKPVKLLLGAGWNFLWNWRIQGFGALSAPVLALYNGEKGKNGPRYFFYVFYPAHLLLLAGIRYFCEVL